MSAHDDPAEPGIPEGAGLEDAFVARPLPELAAPHRLDALGAGQDGEPDEDTEPLPPYRETLADLKAQEEAGTLEGYRLPTVDAEGQPYVGYWEDLEVPPAPWRRTAAAVSVLVLTGLFVTPELVDGLWWLTLVISIVVVGGILVIGSPGGRRPRGTALFRRRIVLPAVVVAGAVLFGAFMTYDLLAFHTWSLSGPPPKVLACGAEYSRAGAAIPTPARVPLHRVGTTPSGLPILGNADCGRGTSVWAFVGIHGQVVPYEISRTCAAGCPAEPYSK